MRAPILNILLGALGLAAVALSAPSDDESSVCVAPSTNTIFITVPQSYSTIYITVPATSEAPVTTQYSTLQSIVYSTSPVPTQQFSVGSEASSSMVGTTTTSHDTTVTESPPAVTVTQIWSESIPAIAEDSSTAGYSFIVNSGTTSWVDDHTPTLTGPVVIKTSSITVSPVSTFPLETSTLTLHITVKSTSQLTVTKTLPAPTQGSYTGLASGGWNSTGSSIFSGAKGATAVSTPLSRSALNEPHAIVSSGLDQTDSVATNLAAQSGFRVESSSIPIVWTTDKSHALSTINTYHSSYAVISLTSFAAEAGFHTGLTSLSLAPLSTSTASSTSVLAQMSTQSRQYTLSTVYSTSEITVTSCHATVTDCPAGPHTETITIAVSTTWCPVEATQTSSAVTNTATFPSGLSLTSPTSGAPWTNSTSGLAPSTSTTIASISSSSQGVVTSLSSPTSVTQWTTSTVYTTSEITVTSCASSVTNCPAGPHVTTITIPLYTTICPVTATQPAQTPNATVSGDISGNPSSIAPWANSSSLTDFSSVQGVSTFTASPGLTTGFSSMPTANTTVIPVSSKSGASTSGLGNTTWSSTNLSSLSITSTLFSSLFTESSLNVTTAPSGAISTSAMTTCSDDGWNSTQSTMIPGPTATSTAQSSVSMSTSASSHNTTASILSSITIASPISSSQNFSTVSSVAPIITTAPVLNYTSSYVSSISPSQLAPNTTLSYDSTLSPIISSVSISQVQSYDSTLSPILSSASLPQVQSSTPGLITSLSPTCTQASSSLAGNRTSTIPSATPSSCGEVGDFILHFDDAPVNPNTSGVEPHPVFNPYHQFDFSDGFTVVPYPIDPYQPSSGSHLVEFIPFYNINGTNDQAGPNTAELGYTGQISDGDNYQTGCFKFNVYGAAFGCNSTGPTCDFTITGWNYDISTSTPTLVSRQELSIPACTTFAKDDQSCSLVPVNLEDTFKDLSFVQFNVTVASAPQVWYMDDLRVGWFDNSCATGLCRQQTHLE